MSYIEENEDRLEEIKQEKAKAKSAFTRSRHKLLQLMEDDLPSRRAVRSAQDVLNKSQEKAMELLSALSDEYAKQKDKANRQKVVVEMEKIDAEFTEVQDRAQEYLDNRKDETSSIATMDSEVVRQCRMREIQAREQVEKVQREVEQKEQEMERMARELEKEREQLLRAQMASKERFRALEKEIENELGINTSPPLSPRLPKRDMQPQFDMRNEQCFERREYNGEQLNSNINKQNIANDMWKQLKRVSIPVFSGNKQTYESWKAAFTACIDQAPATPEYKLLQLRQYLSGEPLRVIEKLGHSAAAYEAAKERLERKYGGKRRQVNLYMEELDNFKPIRAGNSKDLERFADILDVTVVNLKEAGLYEELGNGSLYIKLQKKMPEPMLTRYHRWIFETEKVESVETLRIWIIQEAEFHTIASETVQGLTNGKRDETGLRKGSKTFFGSNPEVKLKDNGKKCCEVCGNNHGIWNCENFKRMSVDKRWEVAKQLKLCYHCLGKGHMGQTCFRSRVCGLNDCKGKHHRLLHATQPPQSRNYRNQAVESNTQTSQTMGVQTKEEQKEERSHSTSTITESHNKGFVALRTVPVVVKNGARKIEVNALLDDASTKTYLNADIAAELGLEGETQRVNINVLNGQVETFETVPVELGLESVDGSIDVKIEAFTTTRVTGNMEVINWSKHANKWDHLKEIKFPNIGPRPIVDLLIGVDHADLHCSYKDVCGEPGQPIARQTPLGWTCIGNPNPEVNVDGHTEFAQTYFVREDSKLEEIDSTLRKFWEIETVGTVESNMCLTVEEQIALNKVEGSLKFLNDRYQVSIPWKEDTPKLPNNYDIATRRLQNTEKRLNKDPEIAKAYAKKIDEYVEKDYIRKVAPEEPKGKWYLPHFPVVRPERKTTKTRIVFDASAKCEGVSLNDTIHQGPKLQNDLFDVLLRFRRHPVALVCDIAEMYLRIEIAPQDRTYHRFLWRDLSPDKEPDEYEFNRVVFGVNSSPFQAQFVSQKNATAHKEEFPMAAETVLKSTYMDDSLDSVPDENQGIELYSQLSELWIKAGMYARKWLSNSSTVLENIPLEDRATEVDLGKEHLPSAKTLGLLWLAKEDVFAFKANVSPNDNCELTKREFLRKIAKLFDPMGFLAPFLIRAKILLQEMWSAGLEWDEPLDECLIIKARRWFEELPGLVNVKVPRCLRLTQDKAIQASHIHTFVDASQEAYGAAVYNRIVYKDGTVSTRLVAAKTRVAPLAAVSIPRLELMGAIVGLQLAKRICKVLELELRRVIFWSDSMNVLWWIRRRSRQYKPFVANRIGEIQSNTSPEQWRHIPTSQNPADLLTRGIPAVEMTESNMWWNGPEFLQEDESKWPTNVFEQAVAEDKEIKKGHRKPQFKDESCNFTETEEDCSKRNSQPEQPKNQERGVQVDTRKPENRLDPRNFSSWKRLQRVQAWVRRFIKNCQLPIEERKRGELTSEEIADEQIELIKQAQKTAFPEEYSALEQKKQLPRNSKLMPLNPKLDEDGLIRSDSRLKYAEFISYDTRYPIILPRKNWITKLIVKFHHEEGNHAGTNHILASLSSQFWIISGREEIREWEKECSTCRRKKASAANQIMAPIPRERLIPLRAFAHTAVDYGGPFITIQGRRKPRMKRYLCLFTCLATRAIHLEMAYSLDTDSFLNAFYRMASRRGLPKVMFSDNGSNFIGAERELRELVEQLDQEKINKSTASKGIKWKFNPPAAPHFGGIHESMIKAAKKAIKAILGNADIKDEELMTAFTGVEGLINSRPLTYQSANPEDDTPLTPNHFLYGQAGGQFAPESVDETAYNPIKRWRRVQELMRHYWHRWIREWLPSLSARKKWQQTKQDLQEGDVVLMLSPDSPRGHWPLGRILEVYPGKDGHVRVAKVQVGQSQLIRPISKLCPLEYD